MFKDRVDAGQQLAQELRQYGGDDTVILALARGGAAVGAEVAKVLRSPLGLLLVRKIAHPKNPEYALGAIADNGDPVYNYDELSDVESDWLREAEADARKLLRYRQKFYYGKDTKPVDITGKFVIIVDDGMATGLSIDAAVKTVKDKQPTGIIVAVPVASAVSVAHIKRQVTDVVVLTDPNTFLGYVGAHYKSFNQVTDEEVYTILREVQHVLQR